MRTIEKIIAAQKNRDNIRFCPLCNSEPEIESSTYDPWGDGAGNITEYWCQCSGCGVIRAESFTTYNYTSSEAQQRAKEDWNETIDYLNSIIIFKKKEEKEEEK